MRMLRQKLCVLDGQRLQFNRESFQLCSLGVRQFAFVVARHQIIQPLLRFRVDALKLWRRLPDDEFSEIDIQGFADGPNHGSANVDERFIARQPIDRFQIESMASFRERFMKIDDGERAGAHQFLESRIGTLNGLQASPFFGWFCRRGHA
jgi:hypothetical protein